MAHKTEKKKSSIVSLFPAASPIMGAGRGGVEEKPSYNKMGVITSKDRRTKGKSRQTRCAKPSEKQDSGV